ncbi:hypothetical protein OPV22_019850 [Ensete ventricosum]|uniref:BHLH domain-containing protein n=1 Tax=Ensete ventricosum TaxID=4639 RepID=A0AAV8QIV0_ENSVE|nr:hypothetical protein OPV22_019850 [Ensete ventricosum]
MDPSWELMSLLEELNGYAIEIPGVDESDLFHQAELCVPFPDHLSGSLPAICLTPTAQPQAVACRAAGQSRGDREMKDIEAPDASSEHSSVPPPATRATEVKMKSNKNILGNEKRPRGDSKKAEKPKEVVLVRARRGQATDSHSLAERVRRKRINDRMRCLQGLVPCCHKAMGMARSLDEIINYVQSLQNQVEFLSMKLSAASSFYGCCFDMETIAAPQVMYACTEAVKFARTVLMSAFGSHNASYDKEC